MYSKACHLQYRRLRATVSGVLVSGLRWGFLAAALVFWAYGLIGGQHWSTMVGVLFAIITAGSWQSATLMRHALQAFDSSLVQFGQVQISTRQWSDAVRYEAQVRVSDGQAWAFEFMPLGKPPAEGLHAGLLHYLPGMDWPALVSVEAGLLVPRYTPKPMAPGA